MSEILLAIQVYTFAYSLLSLAQTMQLDTYCFTPEERVTLINAYPLFVYLNNSYQKFWQEKAKCVISTDRNKMYDALLIQNNAYWKINSLSVQEVDFLYNDENRETQNERTNEII